MKKQPIGVFDSGYGGLSILREITAALPQYDFILDKSEGITVIFADPKLDKSEYVLRIIGVK